MQAPPLLPQVDGAFMDLKSNFSREWTAGVLFRMQRGIQPTIRLWSLIVRNRQVTVCRVGAHAHPGTYARRGSILVRSLKGLSGGVMLHSFCPLRPLSYEALIANARGVSQATSGWRGHRQTAGFADGLRLLP